eukprot:jgi/Ulvmu1/3510/UM162_0017.1
MTLLDSLREAGGDECLVTSLAAQVQAVENLHAGDPTEAWSHVSKTCLSSDVPFAAHVIVLKHIFRNWEPSKHGPHPVWIPTLAASSNSNVCQFMRDHQSLMNLPIPQDDTKDRRWPSWRPFVRNWRRLHAITVRHPQSFWPKFMDHIGLRLHAAPHSILTVSQDGNPDHSQWLAGARMNIAQCALEGLGRDPDAAAVVFASASAPSRIQTWTYRVLKQRAYQVAVALRAAGHGPGCRVAIIGAMTPDAVATYLAVVLVGGAVVSVADSFSPEEMYVRLKVAQATLIIVQAHLDWAGKKVPLYAKVASIKSDRAPAVVIVGPDNQAPMLASGDTSWDAFIRPAQEDPAAVLTFLPASVSPDTVSNVLFSSGTTGTPKAIPWTHTTPLRPAVNGWSCQDIQPGNVVAWPTNLGWMMGPWLIYASLLNRAAIGLFLGAPTGRPFCEFVAHARVTMLGVVPSIVKAWRVGNCTDNLDWAAVRCFSSSGEASNPEDMLWLMSRAGYKPVMEYLGGTEIGGAFVGGTMLHACVPSCFATASLGFELFVLGPEGANPGSAAARGVVSLSEPDEGRSRLRGEVAVRMPAIGCSQTLLNRDHYEEYFSGMPVVDGLPLRRHGDELEELPGLGYLKAHGRCDDTMNLGGIKVGSVEIERACTQHVALAREVAAVAVPPAKGGPEQLVLFVVPSPAAQPSATLQADLHKACQAAIRTHLNPLFKVSRVVLCERLPRNASNKVMRRVLRDQVKSSPLGMAKL